MGFFTSLYSDMNMGYNPASQMVGGMLDQFINLFIILIIGSIIIGAWYSYKREKLLREGKVK